MRVTRAAQRAQQDVEELIEAPEVSDRALKDIEPNASSPVVQTEEPLPAKTPAKPPAKRGKGKGGKKGTKSKKAQSEDVESVQAIEEAGQRETTGSDGETVEHEPTQELADGGTEPSNNRENLNARQSSALRLTRRQLAKLEEDETLGSSERAPSTREENATGDTVSLVVEPSQAAVYEKTRTSPEQDDTPTRPNQPMEVEPRSAPKPVRVTRRKQTKLEEEHGAQGSEKAAEKDIEGFEAPSGAEHDVATKSSPLVADATEGEPEVGPKPKRLTRRQQAKLDEEQQRTQAEQQTTPDPTEAVVVDVVTKPRAVIVGEEQTSEQMPAKEVSKIEDIALTSASAVEEQSTAEEELEIKSLRAVEEVKSALKRESQDIEVQVSETVHENDHFDGTVETRPATPTEAEFEAELGGQVDDSVTHEPVPSVEITLEAEPKMLCDEKPFEALASTPKMKQDSIRRRSRSPSKSPMRIEESISAIDRLEEDLESIGKAIPDLGHSDEEIQQFTKSTALRGKTPSKTPIKALAARAPAKITSKTSTKTPSKAPITTKAPVASRISKVPNAAPKSVKPTTASLMRASSVRSAPVKDGGKPSTETADYLASKRRPISLSFPTPPPPPKGRAPTEATFQLSSDNVAAKLKAQKEERLKREVEGAAAPKQRPLSMPPPPKSTKPPTVPSFQLPGEATAAKLKAQKEERLKRMEKLGRAEKTATRPISMPPPLKSTKPVTKASFQLPGEATAARLKIQKEERMKRMEEAEAARKATLAAPVRKPIVHRPRESLLVRDAPSVSIPLPQRTDVPQRSTSLASKRSSIVGPSGSRSTSTSSANRNSILLAEGGKSTVGSADAAALKMKGKQVFNRDKIEKQAMERERREKEEAAKKARAEAAERGRIASREWAERQRQKLMG